MQSEKPATENMPPNMNFTQSEAKQTVVMNEKSQATKPTKKLVSKLNLTPSPTPAVTRQKTALKPGHSLMDWIRFGHSGKDLTGVGGRFLNVTKAELAKHNTVNDAWLCINGKVFNVTAYMEYHPGGEEELLRGVGKDATELFMQTHRWVNYESMLQKCVVGRLSVEFPLPVKDDFKEGLSEVFALPEVISETKKQLPLRYEWCESDSDISFTIETKYSDIKMGNIIIDLEEFQLLLVTFYLENSITYFHLKLFEEVQNNFQAIICQSGDVRLVFDKKNTKYWNTPGRFLKMHNCSFTYEKDEMKYRQCKLITKRPITADVFLFTFQLPDGCSMIVPVGHHIQIAKDVNDTEVVKSYTPVPKYLSYKVSDTEEFLRRQLHLMIKIYPDGVMTPEIGKLKIGDKIKISNHLGSYTDHFSEETFLILLAAGTGFTPMAGIINKIFYQQESNINSQVDLVFFNQKECNILWRDQLDSLAAETERFRVTHVLSDADESWTGLRGRVNGTLLSDFLSKLQHTVKESRSFCICGPNAFTLEAVRILVEELKYDKKQIHAFLN